jgi:hypothetical protein
MIPPISTSQVVEIIDMSHCTWPKNKILTQIGKHYLLKATVGLAEDNSRQTWELLTVVA